MGSQRNNPQLKRKEESPEKELNDIEANLSDIEFKVMVIKRLQELSENYKEVYGTTRNFMGTT